MRKENTETGKAERTEITKTLNEKSLVGAPVSINDLRDKEYNGEKLSKKEKLALISFDKYRIAILNSQTSEGAFQCKYLELQAMANLTSYEEFLEESYLVL